jgi:stage II sporulation protein D
MDEYLYSVVPVEMGEDFHLEALKAQSGAARTSAFYKKGIHADDGYDLCDGSHCLSYRGVSSENDITIQAVNETSGRVMTYEGEAINAVYFASSGGVTDSSENVWNEPVPYLRGVNDPVEHEPSVWARSFSYGEIQSLLASDGVNIGTVTSVSITRTSDLGRVQELTIQGTAGTETYTKEGIRTFFSGTKGGSLDSRYFTLGGNTLSGGGTSVTEVMLYDGLIAARTSVAHLFAVSADGVPVALAAPQITDGTSYAAGGGPKKLDIAVPGGDVAIVGSGWGHGVGLSQRGAEGLAQSGQAYDQILRHYYTGIVIE